MKRSTARKKIYVNVNFCTTEDDEIVSLHQGIEFSFSEDGIGDRENVGGGDVTCFYAHCLKIARVGYCGILSWIPFQIKQQPTFSVNFLCS